MLQLALKGFEIVFVTITLGEEFKITGKLERAEATFLRVLKRHERTADPNKNPPPRVLNNLATLHLKPKKEAKSGDSASTSDEIL